MSPFDDVCDKNSYIFEFLVDYFISIYDNA